VVVGREGNLYGTTAAGGGGSCSVFGAGCGIVFELTPSNGHFKTLWQFTGGTDGAAPYAGLIIGPGGVLYGSTVAGGGGSCAFGSLPGCGMVFRLSPPVSPPHSIQGDHWIEDVLYRFRGSDGFSPLGDLVMDHSGSIYGSAFQGGSSGFGVVFKLTPSNGMWDESVLHNFDGSSDGSGPNGIILDASGNIFGTTQCCGSAGGGTVYELLAGSGWTENILYSFILDGGLGNNPYSGVTFDSTGNLYSTTWDGQGGRGGTAFELSSGNRSFHLLYSFSGSAGPRLSDLVFDPAGNLYGTTV
jgi:uncharacterized repeat protein (TIGR03803 family)